MPDTQREWDELNIEAKAEADAVMAAWTQEFLGHRAGGTLSAPSPAPEHQPMQPQPAGGPVAGQAAPAPEPESPTGGY